MTDQNGQPKPGIQIQLAVTVQPGSGGHLHHPDRPLGALDLFDCGTAGNPRDPCVIGATGPDGVLYLLYAAPELSGTYQFTATCISQQCAGKTDTKSINVMLDKLVPITASPGNCYTLTDAAGVIGAEAGQHTDNHWVRTKVPQRLEEFACIYTNGAGNGAMLYLNDASLIWGGLFEPHTSHRFGWSIDIRAQSGEPKTGEVPLTVAKKLIRTSGTTPSNEEVQIHCFKAGNIQIAKFGKSSSKCDKLPDGRHLHVDFK